MKKINTYLQLHLFELKYNIIIFLFIYTYLFLICYFFSDQLIFLFVKNLIKSDILKYFIFTNITEIVFTNFLISFTLSFFLSFHLLLLQIWFFLSKGLFKYENLKIIKFLFFFFLFNILVFFIIIIKIIPNIWFFFIKITFSTKYLFNIFFEPKLNNYFDFLFSSYIYIYICFIYFFFFSLLLFNKNFKIKTIINLRKIFYFKYIILSTIIAPPEVVGQLFICICFIFYFEIIIFFYLYINKYLN